MEKQIILAICERLSEISSLRWIDAEEGQLNAERPAVAYPCCLVEMSYPQCEQLTPGKEQKVTVNIRLVIAFDSMGQTNMHAPEKVRNKAFERMDILQEIHNKLQWWDNKRMFFPLRRIQIGPTKRSDGIKVYEAVYRTMYIDV